MNGLILFLRKRIALAAVLALALAVWFGISYLHYESYWNGTIFRVQTVDLNILHHTVPRTLSQLIVAGRDDEIQKVLDSTYGLFGLIVTNPDGTEILYNTMKSRRRGGIQNLGSSENLSRSGEPYDLLTDPPPSETVYEHKSPGAAKPDRVGADPAGQVLGRVYYVRSVPPQFLSDLTGLFTMGVARLPGAKRGYAYITVMVVGFTLAILALFLWRKRELAAKRDELRLIENDLMVRRRVLDQLTRELSAQRARKEWLERESDQAYRRALVLKDALVRLRDSMGGNGAADAAPGGEAVKLRPAVHPPSSLLEEIEALIPELDRGARDLRGQAEQLNEQCHAMERRHAEMKQVLEQVSASASATLGKVAQFRAVR